MDKKHALERLDALEQEAKKLRDIIIDAPEVGSLLPTNATHSKCKVEGFWNSTAEGLAYAEAIDTMILLRRQPGSEATKTDRQWTIDYHSYGLRVESWTENGGFYAQVSLISPSFNSEAHAKAAIDAIGEDRLIRMFETLHGLKGAA